MACKEGRPNVLMIMLDTASTDIISCYGKRKGVTPFIDSVARRGVRFQYCFTNGPWTPPSHAALFSGLPSLVNGISHDSINIRTKEMFKKYKWSGKFPTLASLLSENGYQTVGVCANAWVGSKSNMCYGFQRWIDFTGKTKGYGDRYMKKYDRSTAAFLQWVDDEYQSNKPYFAYVNYLTTHLRRTPKPQFEKKFVRGKVKPYLKEITSLNCFHYLWNGLLKKEDLPVFIDLYYALAAQVDSEINDLVTELEKRGLLDNTILIILSDHGDENAEHNLLDHQFCVYNTLIHVPLIFSGPGVPRGRVERKNVQMLDVPVTVLDMVGLRDVRKKSPMEGMNLFTEVPKLKRERVIVSEHGIPRLIVLNMGDDVPPEMSSPYLRRLKAVIYGEWKYIWASDGRDELYNLKKDFGETRNLIDRYPAKAKELYRKLVNWVRAHGFKPSEVLRRMPCLPTYKSRIPK